IMFDEHGLAVVTDFGIAKAASGGKLTGTGMSIGTPHYMSPEQARAQALDGRSDLYSLGVVAYQSLTGRVPFDGEDSFSIGYKHIMEEIPTPPLETYDQRTVFEITKKMMAKSPDERFQSADDLVQTLEAGGGFAAVGLATAATKAIPSLAGVRMASAPTTPLPRLSGKPGAEEHHKRSVAAGIALWVVVLAIGLGAPGLYAYKKGLLFFARAAPADSASGVPRDTLAQRLLSDTGVSPPADTAAQTAAATLHADTARTRVVPPGTLGRLTLQGLPQGARVTLNGMPFRGSQGDVPPGTYRLAVRASGFEPYDRQVVITPGAPSTVRIDLQPASEGGSNADPCDQPGPAYNQDNLCFDTRPVPLSATRIPVPPDATIFPRQTVLLIHVSKEGSTLEARVWDRSNLETFNNEALDMAKTLRWNPAQKNGEPVDAWVKWPFQPVRQ
ncbi:MAG TPA: energy transducer TonB, partial [Gemmatimonadales bacterium]|nr:energy transducer TonB [Gemmatimonadales bacterium]